MSGDDVAAALRAVLDRQAVVDVVARFCDCLDRHDIPGLVEVFTTDCTTDYGPARGGPTTGREATIARIGRGQAAFRRTHHQLGQSVVRLDGDLAHACTYVTATHEDTDGTVSRVHLRYVDSLRLTQDGWRIHHRIAEACVVDGMPTDGWHYVARHPPAT